MNESILTADSKKKKETKKKNMIDMKREVVLPLDPQISQHMGT